MKVMGDRAKRGVSRKLEGCAVKNRILVVEDEKAISDLICMNLQATGYETVAVFSGEEVKETLEKLDRPVDLALADVMLPGMDGFELMELFQKRDIPVIYLTAKGDVASKVRGLKLGAEDYIVKPFEVLELLVRMEKVLERRGKMRSVLESGNLRMDMTMHRVWEDGQEIALKPMEYKLLEVFLKNRNVLLGRGRLLDIVWGDDFCGETRTVDVHVASLRKKLKACAAIRTVPKAGYMYEDESL